MKYFFNFVFNLLICICLSLTFSTASFSGVVLSKSNFDYLGAFRVSQGNFGSSSFSGNSYVNAQYQPMAYNPNNNSLFLGQRTDTATKPKRVGEISIPNIINPIDVNFDILKLETASIIQNIQDISDGGFDKIKTDGLIPSDEAKAQLGGLFVYQNKLFGTVWSYFDASGSNSYRSHWRANTNWETDYNFNGIHAVGTSPTGSKANGGFVGGYMCEVPDEYKNILGYPLLTGRTGGPIVGRSSYGPSLWGFSPDDFNYDTPADATMFIGYTSSYQTLGGYEDTPSMFYNRSTGIKGVLWPQGSDSILFFGVHGLGIVFDNEGKPLDNTKEPCFGAGTSNRNEAKTNDWLLKNAPDGWVCGYQKLTASDISGGAACCFDPVDPSVGQHFHPFVIGKGGSAYGPGTKDYKYARTNEWLKNYSPKGYDCNGKFISPTDISSGNACSFVGTGATDKGGSSYPNVYQVWQYHVNDLIDVKNGIKKPWEIIPDVWNFDLPFDNPNQKKQVLGVAYDEANQIVYIGQAFGDGKYPLIHAFKITSLGLTSPIKIPSSPTSLKISN